MNEVYKLDARRLLDWSPKLAYFLGFCAGDGHISRRSNCVYVRSTDREVVEWCKKWIGAKHKVGVIKKEFPRKVQFELRFEQDEVSRIMRNWRLRDPDVWVRVPSVVIFSFVRGFFDADGSVGCYWHKKERKYYLQIRFVQKSFEYLEGLREILLENEIKVSRIGSQKGTNTFYLNLADRASRKLASLMYDGGFCLKRKQRKFGKRIGVR